jgi:hypothetical protein
VLLTVIQTHGHTQIVSLRNQNSTGLLTHCVRLLQAASRDDCSPQTLYDLRDAVEESEQDWIQALPIFLKHLSFPLHPPPYPEDDAPEHPLDTLARSALFPILGVLRRFKPAGSTLPTAVVRAAPDIWRWLSRWTCAAFLANGELATSRMHIFEHVLQAVNALTPHQDLVVVEAFDVVVTHFCLAGRSKRLQTIVDAVGQKLGSALSNAVETAALGYDMVVQHLKLVAQSIFHKSVGQHLIGPSALLVALLQCSEEILHHGCIYLDLRHRDNREPLRRATLSNSYSLMLIFQVITAIDPAKISVLPESLLRRTLASVLRVYHSVIRLAADTASVFHSDGELRSLCDVCCDILLSVIAGQQSVLRSCALLHWALRNGMLQAIVQTPAHGAGDTVKAEVAVELGRPEFDFDGPKHVLDMVVLPRMWCLSVYEAVAESIKTAPCASASLLLGRWAGVHSLTIDRMLPLKSTCNHRLVCAVSRESYGADLLQCVNRDSNTRRRRCAGCMHAYFCSPSCQRT